MKFNGDHGGRLRRGRHLSDLCHIRTVHTQPTNQIAMQVAHAQFVKRRSEYYTCGFRQSAAAVYCAAVYCTAVHHVGMVVSASGRRFRLAGRPGNR